MTTGAKKDLTFPLVVVLKQAIFPFKLLNASDGTRSITLRNGNQKTYFFYLQSSVNNSWLTLFENVSVSGIDCWSKNDLDLITVALTITNKKFIVEVQWTALAFSALMILRSWYFRFE